MKFIQPNWVEHTSDKGSRQAIYSVHWHPDGKRVATGGTGPSTVKIWNVDALLDEEYSEAERGPRLLSSLTNHDATVLVVRWCNDSGKRLASGGDDRFIMIWEQDAAGRGGKSFGSTTTNVEHYRVIKVLRGHDSDVVDLAWSPENEYIASCSMDRNVIIWDGRGFEKLRTLSGHNGFVKGVAWDPVGKYLATLADDHNLRLWALNGRPSDWECDKIIEEPFRDSLATFFSRLSFSPEGTYLIAPTGVGNGLPTSPLLDRSAAPPFSPALTLVGHEETVECAAFSPVLFRHNGQPAAYLATCSEDGTVAVWTATSSRALCVIEGILASGPAVKGVHDAQWSPNGTTLAVVTHGGFMSVLSFDSSEFGEPIGPDEVRPMLETYGYVKRRQQIAESPAVLALEVGGMVGAAEETHGVMGKRMGGGEEGGLSGTRAGKEDVVMAERDGPAEPMPAPAAVAPEPPAPPPVVQKTKDGRKRIAPTFIRSLTEEEPGDTFESAMSSIPFPTSTPSVPSKPAESATAISTSTKRSGSTMDLVPGTEGVPSIPLVPVNLGYFRNASGEMEKISLGVREIESRLFITVPMPGVEKSLPVLECKTQGKGSSATTTLRLARDTTTLWDDQIPSRAIAAISNGEYTAVSTEDGGLWTWTQAGRRLLPCITLEGPASFLVLEGDLLMAVSSVGGIDIWNLKERRSLLSNISVGPVLSALAMMQKGEIVRSQKLSAQPVHPAKPTIAHAMVLPDATPLVLTPMHGAFRFDPQLNAWTKVLDVQSTSTGTEAVGPLLEEQNRAARIRAKIHEGVDRLASIARGKKLTTGFLENQMTAALSLKSMKEYRYWMKIYAHKLAEDALVDKARELVDELAGATIEVDLSETAPKEIGEEYDDAARKILLMDIIPILAKQRAFQRVVTAVLKPGSY